MKKCANEFFLENAILQSSLSQTWSKQFIQFTSLHRSVLTHNSHSLAVCVQANRLVTSSIKSYLFLDLYSSSSGALLSNFAVEFFNSSVSISRRPAFSTESKKIKSFSFSNFKRSGRARQILIKFMEKKITPSEAGLMVCNIFYALD